MLRQLVVPALRSALNAVLPAGGSAGQVLVKKSDTDRDVEWANAAQEAKSNHLGLWQNTEPVPPWQFRKKAKQSK